MTLTIELTPEQVARLIEVSRQAGWSAEDAAQRLIDAATNPFPNLEVSPAGWTFVLLVLALLLETQPPTDEMAAQLAEAVKPFVFEILKNGTAEEIAAILPTSPVSEPALADLTEAEDERRWEEAFTHTTPEDLDRLMRWTDELLKQGTMPLDFSDK